MQKFLLARRNDLLGVDPTDTLAELLANAQSIGLIGAGEPTEMPTRQRHLCGCIPILPPSGSPEAPF
jgi:hypothetical protein